MISSGSAFGIDFKVCDCFLKQENLDVANIVNSGIHTLALGKIENMNIAHRRLFFALNVEAPWPENLPSGRILSEKERHITLAFLGNVAFQPLENLLNHFPLPPFQIALAGKCDRLLFLPEAAPRVVATHVSWFKSHSLDAYYNTIIDWLSKSHYELHEKSFLPHVTIARAPFEQKEWKKMTLPFPIIAKGIHLYETIASLTYHSLWNISFELPFEEIEHTADIAFIIRGVDIYQIYLHAQIALAFKFPPLLNYMTETSKTLNLDQVIIELNALISRIDSDIGCPFKAISFHGEISLERSALLHWEMIVDV
jgi:2'-5' RNA ligase